MDLLIIAIRITYVIFLVKILMLIKIIAKILIAWKSLFIACYEYFKNELFINILISLTSFIFDNCVITKYGRG